jgi:YHS domain-containing protein
MRQLLFLAFIVALGYLISKLLLSKRRVPRETGGRTPTAVTQEMVRDPVCHLYLPHSEAIRRKIRGQEHFFCSPGCVDKFLALRS